VPWTPVEIVAEQMKPPVKHTSQQPMGHVTQCLSSGMAVACNASFEGRLPLNMLKQAMRNAACKVG
jgi:hypothetical protein